MASSVLGAQISSVIMLEPGESKEDTASSYSIKKYFPHLETYTHTNHMFLF